MRMSKRASLFLQVALAPIAIFFLFYGVMKAKAFLAPLLLAVFLALLMTPVSRHLERMGMRRVLATSCSTLVVLLVSVAFVLVVFFQVKDFTGDWEEIRYRMDGKLEELSAYLVERTPLDEEQVSGYRIDLGFLTQVEGRAGQGINLMMSLFGFLTQCLIVIVYVFLFIHYRQRFKQFILKFFPQGERERIGEIIVRSSDICRRYLAGKLLLMVFLAMLYFVGLWASGLENAFLISLLAAALSIIPVVGNFIAYLIAIAVSLLSDGGTGTLIGITLTFALAQIIDTYILQPIVLGDKVDVHPVFIILSVVLGYFVWGIMGLVLAVPLFGMVAVICRYVPVLQPFGYLFSRNSHPPG